MSIMPSVTVRTLTLGIPDAHPLTTPVVQKAAKQVQSAQARFMDSGFDVQTVRLSTHPLFDDCADWSPSALLRYARDVQRMLEDVGIGFCSFGPAQVARHDFPLERIDIIADLLEETTALNATVQLATQEYGLRAGAALPTARVIQRLAAETEEGFGNFRFALLACVAPGSPFFPAAYHEGAASLAVGVQGASIVAEVLRACQADMPSPLDLERVSARVQAGLQTHLTPVVQLVQQCASEQGLRFGGIDTSPAPMGRDSIVAALELCGYGRFGTPGTLAVAAALTAALKSTDLPTCGYCGLMLPVLEDAVLGQRWAEGMVNAHQLLLYSTVCGTGLDTVPLPGDIPAETIAHLLLDVATLALRLRKPLSARLFPVPGKRAGDSTSFTSPYLTNTTI